MNMKTLYQVPRNSKRKEGECGARLRRILDSYVHDPQSQHGLILLFRQY